MGQSRTVIEGWPALMSTETAARYTSLDETSFTRLAARFNTCPVDLDDDKPRWRKSDLDHLIRRLPTVPAFLASERPLRSTRLDDVEIGRIVEALARRLESGTPSSQPALVSIKDAATVLGIARSTIYRLINEGELSTRQIGRRTLIPMSEIQVILAGSGTSRQGDAGD